MARVKTKVDLKHLHQMIPPVFARKDIAFVFKDLFPGVFTKHQFEHYDSRGIGPKRSKIGRKVVYFRDDFLNWLESNVYVLM